MAGSVSKTCGQCGKVLERKSWMANSQWLSAKYCSKRCSGLRRTITDDQVASEYVSGNSSVTIAEKLGLSPVQVRRILHAAGVMRTQSQAIKLSHSAPDVRAKISMRQSGVPCAESTKEALRQIVGRKHALWRGGLTKSAGGYLGFTASSANGEHACRLVHQVIAEYKIGRRLRRGEHVHHIDGDKLNNHPDNLDVMPASDHARLHAIKNGLGRSTHS